MQTNRIRAVFMTFFIAGRKNWSKKIIKKNPDLECLGV